MVQQVRELANKLDNRIFLGPVQSKETTDVLWPLHIC